MRSLPKNLPVCDDARSSHAIRHDVPRKGCSIFAQAGLCRVGSRPLCVGVELLDRGLSGLFVVILWGKEDVDRRTDITFTDYVRSRLFQYILAGLLLGILYSTVFSVVALVARAWGWGPVITANAWAYAHLGLSVAGLVVTYLFSRQSLSFRLLWQSVIRIRCSIIFDACFNVPAISLYS
jgi:hypothetical protein